MNYQCELCGFTSTDDDKMSLSCVAWRFADRGFLQAGGDFMMCASCAGSLESIKPSEIAKALHEAIRYTAPIEITT